MKAIPENIAAPEAVPSMRYDTLAPNKNVSFTLQKPEIEAVRMLAARLEDAADFFQYYYIEPAELDKHLRSVRDDLDELIARGQAHNDGRTAIPYAAWRARYGRECENARAEFAREGGVE